MPAKDFIEKFKHDPDTFDFEKFKEKMLAEIIGDSDLNAAALTAANEERDILAKNERDLKIRLFDATIGKQGEPVTPQNSPAAGAGGTPPAAPVADADIFG